jgi:hypothetical protein
MNDSPGILPFVEKSVSFSDLAVGMRHVWTIFPRRSIR